MLRQASRAGGRAGGGGQNLLIGSWRNMEEHKTETCAKPAAKNQMGAMTIDPRACTVAVNILLMTLFCFDLANCGFFFFDFNFFWFF